MFIRKLTVLLSLVTSSVFAVPQNAVSSFDSTAVTGKAFVPSYVGGSGAGSWQFVVLQQTNWDPASGSSNSKGGTMIGATWSASWTPQVAGAYSFYVAKCGDGTYDWTLAGPYTLTVQATQPTNTYSFTILVDTNQLNWNGNFASEVTQAELFAGDGTWLVVDGSPANTNWNSVVSKLGPVKIAEDYFMKVIGTDSTNAGYSWTNFLNRRVMSFSEAEMHTLKPGSMDGVIGYDNDCTLLYNRKPNGSSATYNDQSPLQYRGTELPDQLSSVVSSLQTKTGQTFSVVINTRQWTNMTRYADYVKNALTSTNSVGASFECSPDADYARERNVAGFLSYVRQAGKDAYLMLPPTFWLSGPFNSGYNNHLAAVQGVMRYLRETPAVLQDSHINIVLPVYIRSTTAHEDVRANVGFLTGDNGTDANNSIYATINWLNAFRAGMVQ